VIITQHVNEQTTAICEFVLLFGRKSDHFES